ncbi:MAG: zinc-ribbon domain-containing protein [Promethearchaeota archaeon]
MEKYAYCEICKKEVNNPIRKPLTTFQKVVWIVLIVASLGIIGIVYLIIRSYKPKEYCPTCLTKLKFSSEPFKEKEAKEEEVPLTPKAKVMKKVGKKTKVEGKGKVKKERVPTEKEEEEEKEETIFCPYCGEEINANVKKCPYCNTAI